MSSKKRKRNESSTLTRPTLTVASIAMIGFGSVSKTVSNLLIQKKSEFESNYHTKFELVYVSDSSGIIYTQTNGSSLNLTGNYFFCLCAHYFIIFLCLSFLTTQNYWN